MTFPSRRGLLPARAVAGAALVAAFAASLVLTPVARADDGHDDGNGGVQVPEVPVGGGRNAPLTAADRDFVLRVRLAGLWEMPAGMMAVSKGVEPRVREIGQEIAAQHATLDQLDRDAAAQLGVRLPDRPTPEQQGWLVEMQRASGTDFDHVFVRRLRAAHGLIFAAIATIRAGTHNDIVRRLAQQANQFVMTHMALLESTGLVDWADDVPNPPDPAPLHLVPLAAVQPRAMTGGAPASLIWAVLGLAALAAAGALARIVKPR